MSDQETSKPEDRKGASVLKVRPGQEHQVRSWAHCFQDGKGKEESDGVQDGVFL